MNVSNVEILGVKINYQSKDNIMTATGITPTNMRFNLKYSFDNSRSSIVHEYIRNNIRAFDDIITIPHCAPIVFTNSCGVSFNFFTCASKKLSSEDIVYIVSGGKIEKLLFKQ
jgi:hypothetical protein